MSGKLAMRDEARVARRGWLEPQPRVEFSLAARAWGPMQGRCWDKSQSQPWLGLMDLSFRIGRRGNFAFYDQLM